METKQVIMIAKCSKDTYWYKNLVGRTYEVLGENEFGYKVLENMYNEELGEMCEDWYVAKGDVLYVTPLEIDHFKIIHDPTRMEGDYYA